MKEILARVDHTLLAQTSTWEEIKAICDDAVKYNTASVCIPPAFVKRAADYLGGRMRVCTVIGFPNGYNTTAVKCFEAKDALENGADEIDMVINLGMVKEGRFDAVSDEIKALRQVTDGHVLKVIIETCLLTEEEKIQLCKVVSNSGADYIKTSTGFGGGGATAEDIKLFAGNIAPHLKIKASGGIKTMADAEKFVRLGADRLGTSRLVKAAKEAENK